MKIFKVIVALKTPSEEGLKADFRRRSKDVAEAAAFFNDKFARWNKRIFITEIAQSKISMLLIKEVVDDRTVISPLEFGTFSRFLYHNRNWSRFSRETSKLFASVMFREIGRDDAIRIVNDTGEKPAIKNELIELFTSAELHAPPDHETGPDASPAAESEPGPESEAETGDASGYSTSVLADELALKTFQFLIDTQYIGKSSPEKKKIVTKVKLLLRDWLER